MNSNIYHILDDPANFVLPPYICVKCREKILNATINA